MFRPKELLKMESNGLSSEVTELLHDSELFAEDLKSKFLIINFCRLVTYKNLK